MDYSHAPAAFKAVTPAQTILRPAPSTSLASFSSHQALQKD